MWQKNVSIEFKNHNPEFNFFFEQYKNLCIAISENSRLKDLSKIRKDIWTFFFNNEYPLAEQEKKISYQNKLIRLKQKADADEELSQTLKKDMDYTTNKILYRRKYYEYFIEYLKILGDFISELTTIYMPTTNIQKKLVRWANNQMFFEKFTEHRRIVIESLSCFNISENFTECYNKLVTFYYAHSLFIREHDRVVIEDMLSYVLDYYLNPKVLAITTKKDHTHGEWKKINTIETRLHRALLFCLSLMNHNFSDYDVLPKLYNKVYIDKTLI